METAEQHERFGGDGQARPGSRSAPGGGPPPARDPSPSTVLALELRRGLPCVRCRYDLAGLSILHACPECGTPVKATLLCIVDPLAREFQPLRRPRLAAAGLVLWAAMGLAAAVASWWPRVLEAVAYARGTAPAAAPGAGAAAALAVAASALGALALINPHARIPRRYTGLALAALACYPFLAAAVYRLLAATDRPGAMPYFSPEGGSPERSLLRLVIGALLAAVILGLRPAARCLYARSLLFRHGRADRQTLAAIALAVALGAAGDAAHLLSRLLPPQAQEAAWLGGTLAIAVSSLFITVGLVGVLVDVARLAPVLLDPPVTMGSLVRFTAADGPGAPGPAEGAGGDATPPARGAPP